MRMVFLLLQRFFALLWLPFEIGAWLGKLLATGSRALGDNLMRPIYWGLVQAKRRRYGEPLWQKLDWKIGFGPPCEHCGRNVPPDRHTVDCAFVAKWSGSALTVDELKEITRHQR